MTLRPCLDCGEPGDRPRCAEHVRPVHAEPRDRSHVHWNGTRWKKLSAIARRLMPWCADCGRRTQLTTDHVIPVSARPDLAYELDNLMTRCKPCNGRKGDTMPDAATVAAIEARIAARRRRVTGGVTPIAAAVPSAPQAKFASGIGSRS